MTAVDALDRGREAFRRRAWGDASSQLSSADRAAPLPLDDLEHLAVASYLAGRDADSDAFWARAHHGSLGVADWGRAARCAFWLGITLINRMEPARGGGWLARAQRVLDDAKHECVERGWLLVPMALRQYHLGDFVGSATTWAEAANIGSFYDDVDLVTTARHGQGRTLIRLGKTAEGMALLDEAMVAVA